MQLFLDACVIIYFVEMAEPYHKKFSNQLKSIRKKYQSVTFLASELSLLECRVKPMRENNEELLERYQQFFCAKDLLLIPLTPPIIEKAAQLQAFLNLRTPDALQAASALSVDDEALFVTNNRGFNKVPELKSLIII